MMHKIALSVSVSSGIAQHRGVVSMNTHSHRLMRGYLVMVLGLYCSSLQRSLWSNDKW